MKILRKTEAKKQTQTVRTLSQAELAEVSGGINPQPLPPCRAVRA